jgi:hypothetical protein
MKAGSLIHLTDRSTLSDLNLISCHPSFVPSLPIRVFILPTVFESRSGNCDDGTATAHHVAMIFLNDCKYAGSVLITWVQSMNLSFSSRWDRKQEADTSIPGRAKTRDGSVPVRQGAQSSLQTRDKWGRISKYIIERRYVPAEP